MATRPQIAMAVSAIHKLDVAQSQVSLVDQAKECVAVVQALGYYDLAEFLRHMGA